jgi:hypothetical protein
MPPIATPPIAIRKRAERRMAATREISLWQKFPQNAPARIQPLGGLPGGSGSVRQWGRSALGLAALRLRGNNVATGETDDHPTDVNVEGVMTTYYKCFITNKSRYDLKLKYSYAQQFGIFHKPYHRHFDIDPPDLISAGHKPDENKPTYAASATELDGIETKVWYDLMLGDRNLGEVLLQSSVRNDLTRPLCDTQTPKDYTKSEDLRSAEHGPDVTHWSTIMDK